MAVVQISRIQHRRGDSQDLPASLAEGEIGFTRDTGEVFIGAPEFSPIQHRRPNSTPGSQGSYPYSNIKLLTEFDVAWTIRGDVYHQGPLKTAIVPISLLANPLSSNFIITLFKASEMNSAVIDYSLMSNTSNGPLRVGTLWVLTDGTTSKIKSVHQELNVDLGVEFMLNINNGNVDLHAQNNSGMILRMHVCGRQWMAKTP